MLMNYSSTHFLLRKNCVQYIAVIMLFVSNNKRNGIQEKKPWKTIWHLFTGDLLKQRQRGYEPEAASSFIHLGELVHAKHGQRLKRCTGSMVEFVLINLEYNGS